MSVKNLFVEKNAPKVCGIMKAKSTGMSLKFLAHTHSDSFKSLSI